MAFTEQGVAMLSSVLKSNRAVNVNIEIMRTFVKLHEKLLSNKDLEKKIFEMEFRYDAKFKIVFDALDELLKPSDLENKELGFKVKEECPPGQGLASADCSEEVPMGQAGHSRRIV